MSKHIVRTKHELKEQEVYDRGFVAGRNFQVAIETQLSEKVKELEAKVQDERRNVRVELVRAVAQGFDALAHALQENTVPGKFM